MNKRNTAQQAALFRLRGDLLNLETGKRANPVRRGIHLFQGEIPPPGKLLPYGSCPFVSEEGLVLKSARRI